MAGQVTNDQVSAKTLNVNDFRKAVNYVNPKNKGYVRFVPDGKGGVKLAKVNNKIDLFLSLRTNVDAEKNKAMREKFADALTRDLKWADRSKVEKLAESVKLATKGENKGQVRTDALARREVQAAMNRVFLQQKIYPDDNDEDWLPRRLAVFIDKAGEWRRRLDGSAAPPDDASPFSEGFLQV